MPQPEVQQTIAALVSALGATLIPWIVWFFAAKVMPKLPRAALPLLPIVLGWIANEVVKLSTGVSSPVGVAGIALGALVLREIIHTISEHGAAGGGGSVFAPKPDPQKPV